MLTNNDIKSVSLSVQSNILREKNSAQTQYIRDKHMEQEFQKRRARLENQIKIEQDLSQRLQTKYEHKMKDVIDRSRMILQNKVQKSGIQNKL